jgi:class 3 adenylate cyclase
MSQTRRLAAILAADVAGYSRLMGADEEGTHERLKTLLRQLVDPKVKEHRGRIVKNTGDGMLVEFGSIVDAVRCAAEIQQAMKDCNTDISEDKRISFRMVINLGDVIVEPDDIFGDGVNIAARLEALAEPGGICISRVVRDQIRDKLPCPTRSRMAGSRASKTSLGRCGFMRCVPKRSPVCRRRASNQFLQSPSRSPRHDYRSLSCRSPTSATTPSSNISRMGSPRI